VVSGMRVSVFNAPVIMRYSTVIMVIFLGYYAVVANVITAA
jgi:hypothetical protein